MGAFRQRPYKAAPPPPTGIRRARRRSEEEDDAVGVRCRVGRVGGGDAVVIRRQAGGRAGVGGERRRGGAGAGGATVRGDEQHTGVPARRQALLPLPVLPRLLRHLILLLRSVPR